MPYNGSGVFQSLAPPNFPAVANTVIYADRFNANLNDIFQGLTNCVTRDGQSPLSASLPMNGHQLTGLGAPSAAGNALVWGQNATVANLTYTGTLTGGTGVMNLGSGQLYKDASGKVGIGTTAPAYPLDVRTAEPYVSVRKPSANSNFYGYNIMAGSDILSAYLLNAATGQVNLSAGFTGWGGFITLTTNGAERMRVDSAGRVNIGTTSGIRSLNVRRSDSNPYTDISIQSNSSDGAAGGTTIYFGNNTQDSRGYVNYDTQTNYLSFATASSERMRIDSSGNVGINYPPPNYGGSVVTLGLNAAGQALLDLAIGGTRTAVVTTTNSALNIGSITGIPLNLLTGNQVRATIASDGSFFYGSREVGYRDVPRTTGFERGCCFSTTTSQTINTANPGNTFSIYNNSASAITLAQGAGVTLRLAGTTSTGSRTLAPRGLATVWFESGSEAIISGAGVS